MRPPNPCPSSRSHHSFFFHSGYPCRRLPIECQSTWNELAKMGWRIGKIGDYFCRNAPSICKVSHCIMVVYGVNGDGPSKFDSNVPICAQLGHVLPLFHDRFMKTPHGLPHYMHFPVPQEPICPLQTFFCHRNSVTPSKNHLFCQFAELANVFFLKMPLANWIGNFANSIGKKTMLWTEHSWDCEECPGKEGGDA